MCLLVLGGTVSPFNETGTNKSSLCLASPRQGENWQGDVGGKRRRAPESPSSHSLEDTAEMPGDTQEMATRRALGPSVAGLGFFVLFLSYHCGPAVYTPHLAHPRAQAPRRKASSHMHSVV